MTRKKQKNFKVEIISPKADSVYRLGAWPIETEPIVLQAKVFQDSVDISRKVKISWKLKLSWQATHKTYQTILDVLGNFAKVQFQTGGILRVRVAVIIDGKEYSVRIKVNIVGTNPQKKQIEDALRNDLLKAIAWHESTWRQFDNEGHPLLPVVPKGQKVPAMRGLFQISEWWWGRDTRITHQDYNRVAWQWDYNIETAKEILDFLHKIVLKKYPGENEKRQWDRTIKAFNVGEGSIYTKQIPEDFEYVKKVRKNLWEKTWKK